MIRNSFAPVFAAVILLATSIATAQQRRYNIISIVTDDQARWALSCYGNRECPTPNMDRIGREGALFKNALVVTPVCSPSRASYFTGLYGSELGITDWIAGVEQNIGLRADAVTWPKVLQQNGYATALCGKWHLGFQPEAHPNKQGFDHFFGFVGGGAKPMDPELELNGDKKERKGPVSDLFTDDAIRFVEERSKGDKPFALCLNFREPHQPYTPMPKEDSDPFVDLDPTIPKTRTKEDEQLIKLWHKQYYGAVHAADRNIGRVLDKLDQLKIADHTIVMFQSDHGYMIGHHSLHTKGNASWVGGGAQGPKRPNMFENSVRIPLLIRWPGVVKPATVIEQDVTEMDTFPTVLAMLNIPMPADVKQHGTDYTPLLRGENRVIHTEVFGQYDLHNSGLAYMRMIRTPQWKLVRHHFCNGLDELYDLTKDPHESKNLYRDIPSQKTRVELQAKLTAWQKSIDDPILKLPNLTPRTAEGERGIVAE